MQQDGSRTENIIMIILTKMVILRKLKTGRCFSRISSREFIRLTGTMEVLGVLIRLLFSLHPTETSLLKLLKFYGTEHIKYAFNLPLMLTLPLILLKETLL